MIYQIGFKLCHNGLIKIMVRNELENRATIWKTFLKTFQGESAVERSCGKRHLQKGRKKVFKSMFSQQQGKNPPPLKGGKGGKGGRMKINRPQSKVLKAKKKKQSKEQSETEKLEPS